MPKLLMLGFCWVLMSPLGVQAETPTRRVLLLSQGPDGHPAGTHEYTAGMRVLAKCLGTTPGLQVTHVKAEGDWPDGPDMIRQSDGLVLFVSEGARWIHQDPRRLEALAQLASRGGGFVCLHWGMGTKDAQYIDGFLKLFGGCHGGPDRKYQVVPEAKVIVSGHPVTAGIANFEVREEFYYQLKFVSTQPSLKPILQTDIDGNLETVAWAWERGDGGRSFGFSGGHFHDNWGRAEYRRLMAQAALWSLKLPIPESGVPVDVVPADLQLQAP